MTIAIRNYEKFDDCMFLNLMMYDANFINIFYITHNVQLGYDYNYVNLIEYLDHVAKI
jgi:hypothetical protein